MTRIRGNEKMPGRRAASRDRGDVRTSIRAIGIVAVLGVALAAKAFPDLQSGRLQIEAAPSLQPAPAAGGAAIRAQAAASAPLSRIVAPPFLCQHVAISRDHVAFTYAGDIWLVGRRGGQARRFTDYSGWDDSPCFSPDGKLIAFSRQAGDNEDVYVQPVDGGEARRLTWFPKYDIAKGWTPDGSAVLFASNRDGDGFQRLYTVPAAGGMPTPLPLPSGVEGAYSPDGRRLAYLPKALSGFSIPMRAYRGGLCSPLWIVDPATHQVVEVTDDTANARFPAWIGGTVYFLWDKTGAFNLYAHDVAAGTTRALTDFTLFGIDSLAACRDGIAFVHEGRIDVFDPVTRTAAALDVTLEVEAPELVPKPVPAERFVQSARVSRSGAQVVFGARGEVVRFAPESGDWAVLGASSGSAEREPCLSPEDGRVACFSDASGEYALRIISALTGETLTTVPIEDQPSFYREPLWSPDGRRIAFSDIRLALWIADLEAGTAQRIDASTDIAQGGYDPDWSPGGRYLAYSKALDSRLRAVFVYDTAEGQSHRVTDGTTHCEFPVFDRSGRYLYFSSSSNARRAAASDIGWGLLSTVLAEPLVVKTAYAAVLRNDDPAPIQIALRRGHPDRPWLKPVGERIDFEGLDRRFVPLPAAVRLDIAGLAAGRPGTLFILQNRWPDTPGAAGPVTQDLVCLDLGKPGALSPFAAGIEAFEISADGSRALYAQRGRWFLAPADAAPDPKAAALDLKAVHIAVSPEIEWRQMFRDAWRQMRDVFYDPEHHGFDLSLLEDHFGAFLPSITRRSDLNRLFEAMFGMFSVSHLAVGGGDIPSAPERVEVAADPGADFEVANGLVRISRIVRSGHFSSTSLLMRSPMDTPGIDAREGDYLLAVDDEPVNAARNVYSYFAGKANRPVTLRLAESPDGRGARTAVIVPLIGLGALRKSNWAADNGRRVEALSGGRLRYVHVSGYGGDGIMDLNRAILGSSEREGLIIDQRYNGGGTTSDTLIEDLMREPLYAYAYRYGRDFRVPPVFVRGPKVLIINGYDWSAAETFAEMFKLAGTGTIVGTRTGGGGIGAALVQRTLVDGGVIRIPNRAAYNPAGSWDIEGHGVAPHVRADIAPKDWAAGRDPQLEAAVKIALEQLESTPAKPWRRPDYPDHVRR